MPTLITKNSSSVANVPADGEMVEGELAVNTADKRLWSRDATTVFELTDHDILTNYVAAQHVDWAAAAAGTIHTDNYIENATHTGQVTGATALSLAIAAITDQPASGAIVAADTILTNDGGVLSETTFTQLDTYFNSSLSFGGGAPNLLFANYTWGGAGVPAAGEVRSDTGTLNGLSLLRFDDDTSDGVDDFAVIAAQLQLGQLIEIANADLTEYNTFRIDGTIVDQTTRWDVPVKYVGGTQSASGNFTAASAVRVSINPVEILNAVNNGVMFLDVLGTVETDSDFTFTGTSFDVRTQMSIYAGAAADYMRTRMSSGDTTGYVEHVGAGSYGLHFEDWTSLRLYDGSTRKFILDLQGSVFLAEQAAAITDIAAMGQIWVKNDVPNTLWFTGDTGVDVQLGTGSATSLSTGTVTATTYGITSDGGADDVILAEATTTLSGLLGADKWDEIVANSLKATNVSTSLSTGTVTATTYGITSDGGANDVILAEATTSLSGLLGAAKWDEIVANSLKTTNATHTSEVTGATALTVNPVAISNKALVTAVATDMVLLWDATDSTLKRADVDDFLGGSGTVTSSGTPLNNEVAVFATGTDINSDSTFTWDGTNVVLGARALTQSGGYFAIRADTSADSGTRGLSFQHADGTERARIAMDTGGSQFAIRCVVHGMPVLITAEDTGGSQRTILTADPDQNTELRGDLNLELTCTAGADTALLATSNSDVALYFNNTEALKTADRTATGRTASARAYSHAGELTDVGFNLLQSFNFNASDTLEASHCGYVTGKDNTTTTYKLTGPTSSAVDFPVEGVCTVANLGASGDYTLEDTATCTMYYCDGAAAPVDIALNGTLAPGGIITLWRYSTTAIYIFGSGFTP